jgi:hypothetical protein
MEGMSAEDDLQLGKVLSRWPLRTDWQNHSSVRAKAGPREDEKSYPWYKYVGFSGRDLRRSAVLIL